MITGHKDVAINPLHTVASFRELDTDKAAKTHHIPTWLPVGNGLLFGSRT